MNEGIKELKESAVFEIAEQVESVTTNTKVVFTLPDGSKQEVDIPHFNVTDPIEIEDGIKNRYVSELRALWEAGEPVGKEAAAVFDAEMVAAEEAKPVDESLDAPVEEIKL